MAVEVTYVDAAARDPLFVTAVLERALTPAEREAIAEIVMGWPAIEDTPTDHITFSSDPIESTDRSIGRPVLRWWIDAGRASIRTIRRAIDDLAHVWPEDDGPISRVVVAPVDRRVGTSTCPRRYGGPGAIVPHD